MVEFTQVSGVNLAYEVAGDGEPPIVFVHGWSCDRSYLAPQFEFFAPGHAVLALDLRGHGESEKPAPDPGRYDVDVLADDVLAIAAAAGLRRPVLVGHSLGALVGLSAAVGPGCCVPWAMKLHPAPITNERVKAYFRESAEYGPRGPGRGRGAPSSPTGSSCPPTPAAGMRSSRSSRRPRRGSRPPSCRPWWSSTSGCAQPGHRPGAVDRLGAPTQLRGRPAPGLSRDHDWPDGRVRSLQPARSAGPGERHDREIPGPQ